MGVSSNPQVFLSEKDPMSGAKMDPKFSMLVRPGKEIYDQECQTSVREDRELRTKQESVQERDQEEDKDHQQQQQHNNIIDAVPATPFNLKLEIPTSCVDVERSEKDDSDEDGFKTPTSWEHKIPPLLRCPPAPRKPKARPSKKRKACRPRIVIDVSQDLEALFPLRVVADLGAGGKNKKVKHCSGNENHRDSRMWEWGEP